MLRVFVNNVPLPDIAMNTVPSATVAESLQYLRPTDLIQVRSGGGFDLTQANVENVFFKHQLSSSY